MNGDLLDAAACASSPPDWFFPADQRELDRARTVCAGCPVLEQCRRAARQLADELRRDQHYGLIGVWGGELWRGGEVVDTLRRPGAGAA